MQSKDYDLPPTIVFLNHVYLSCKRCLRYIIDALIGTLKWKYKINSFQSENGFYLLKQFHYLQNKIEGVFVVNCPILIGRKKLFSFSPLFLALGEPLARKLARAQLAMLCYATIKWHFAWHTDRDRQTQSAHRSHSDFFGTFLYSAREKERKVDFFEAASVWDDLGPRSASSS